MDKPISELRQDIISGDWVIIATGRSKRPQDFIQNKVSVEHTPKERCPFKETPEAVLVHTREGISGKEEERWVRVVPNLFPALDGGDCRAARTRGPYQWMDGTGFHEVVITRDHERSIAYMTDEEVLPIVRAYHERYRALQEEECVKYISIFHNSGPAAGASVAHPHSQIITTPIIPPEVVRSMRGARLYTKDHRICGYCHVLEYEQRAGERIIYETEHYIVIAPFASSAAFQMRILPKRHAPHFEGMSTDEEVGFAQVLRVALVKLSRGLSDPDYNFFLYTAPVDGFGEHASVEGEYGFYHWHVDILPKLAVWAGFEISTGIKISASAPEEAAAFLAGVTI